jgi:hypothetical protein
MIYIRRFVDDKQPATEITETSEGKKQESGFAAQSSGFSVNVRPQHRPGFDPLVLSLLMSLSFISLSVLCSLWRVVVVSGQCQKTNRRPLRGTAAIMLVWALPVK